MSHPAHTDLARRLLADLDTRNLFDDEPESRIPVTHYTSPQRMEQELQVFRTRPVIVAHASELAEPRACITHDHLGVPVVIVRGDDGRLRGFLNACRHRATRLVDEGPCTKKSFVCPYHNWTYDLSGALSHVPRPEAFCSLDRSQHGLVPVHVEELHGFVWLNARGGENGVTVADTLGPIGEELDSFDLAGHVLHDRVTAVRDANWKLVMDAFLEPYHIRALHRNTIAQFFYDSFAVLDRVGCHLRAGTARKRLPEAREVDERDWELRELITVSYVLFPNTIIIVHPDYVSQISLFPRATDQLTWVHSMLIPAAPANEEERAHWDATLDLIERTVFQKEDLTVAERMQAGIRSGANTHLTLGKLESAIAWFHGEIDAAIESGL